jgi:hypothetical protein
MRNMNPHMITTSIIVLGLVFTLFCMVELRAGSRRVRRYLERDEAGGEESGERHP